jgi:hypothetical protein
MATNKKEASMATNKKVERLAMLLELAKKEEGQLENLKEQARSDLMDGHRKWFPDHYAVFGLENGDRVCVINEIAEVYSGIITEIDIKEEGESSYYAATCAYTNERGKEEEILLFGAGFVHFVRLIEP